MVAEQNSTIELLEAAEIVVNLRGLKRGRQGVLPGGWLFLHTMWNLLANHLIDVNLLGHDEMRKCVLRIPLLKLRDPAVDLGKC